MRESMPLYDDSLVLKLFFPLSMIFFCVETEQNNAQLASGFSTEIRNLYTYTNSCKIALKYVSLHETRQKKINAWITTTKAADEE